MSAVAPRMQASSSESSKPEDSPPAAALTVATSVIGCDYAPFGLKCTTRSDSGALPGTMIRFLPRGLRSYTS